MLDIGTYPGRLESCFIPWNGKNKPLGGTVFCCFDDLWKLCPVQFTGRNLSGRVFESGM